MTVSLRAVLRHSVFGRRLAWLAVVVVAAVWAVGCGENGESGTATQPQASGAEREVTVPIAAAQTEVVDPGAQPRATLRRQLTLDQEQQVTLRTEHHAMQWFGDEGSGDVGAGDSPDPAERESSPPALAIPLTAHVGTDGVDLTLGSVTSSDPALAGPLGAADGSHAGLAISAAGAVTALRMAPKPATPSTVRAILEQAFYQAVYESIVVPEQPVGPGAVWTVRQRVSASGIQLDQVTTATLTQRVGDQLTVGLDVTQTPVTSQWQLPNRAGALDIVDYLMHGTGSVAVDLGLPLPVSGSVTLGGHQVYQDARSPMRLVQDIGTEVRWD